MNILISAKLKVSVFLFGLILSVFNVVWISEPLQLGGQTYSYVEEMVLLLVPRPRESEHQDLNEQEQSEIPQKNTDTAPITSPTVTIDHITDKNVKTQEINPSEATADMITYESLELKPIETPFQPGNTLSSTDNYPCILESDIFPYLNTAPLRSESLPVGIVNLGSTCYANSVIQILFRVPNVRKLILNLEVYHQRALLRAQKLIRIAQNLTQTDRPNYAMKFIRQFEDLIKGIQLAEGLNHMFHQLQLNEPAEPATFARSPKCLQALPGIFSLNEQEDADEYLVAILSALKDIIPTSQHDHFSIKISRKRIHKAVDSSRTVETSRIDILNRISLPLVDGIDSFPELLKALLEIEVTELKLQSDGLPGILTESNTILNLPEFLPIHLQRLVYESNGLRKISRPVNVPEIIDFSPFLQSASSKFYGLEMFLEHCGGPHGGHYVAYCKDSVSGKWNEFNDEKVRQVTEDYIKIKMTTAYIYFYRIMCKM